MGMGLLCRALYTLTNYICLSRVFFTPKMTLVTVPCYEVYHILAIWHVYAALLLISNG